MTDNNRPINPIMFEDYNKISDDIMYLGDCMILKFNTSLYYKDKNGNKQNFHREFEYGPKYDRRKSIRRSYEFYASIENYKPSKLGYKDIVRITMADMYYIKSSLNAILKWYFDESYSNIYGSKGIELIIVNKPTPIEIPLSFNNYIRFEVSIYISSDNINHPGARMYLNHNDNFVDISIDNILAMKYFFDNLNMYESAQSMLNYLQRPEFGTNLYSVSVDNGADINLQKEQDIECKNGRQPLVKKKSMSFFDRVDNDMK